MVPDESMNPNACGVTDQACLIWGPNAGMSVRSIPSIRVTSAHSTTTRAWAAVIEPGLVVAVFDKAR